MRALFGHTIVFPIRQVAGGRCVRFKFVLTLRDGAEAGILGQIYHHITITLLRTRYTEQ